MSWWAFGLWSAMFASVANAADPAAPGDGAEEVGMRKHEAPEPVYVAGPRAAPGPELDRWLAAHAADAVKLPFTVWRGPHGDVTGAAIGSVDTPGDGVRLADHALGIALRDRLRADCGDASRCVVVLTVRAGGLLPGDDATFSVLAFHGVVPDGAADASAVRAADCLAIRATRAVHCARGPDRCRHCRDAAAAAPRWRLLDLCPDDAGTVARPVIDVVRDGRTEHRVYDVLRVFDDAAAARAFAAAHGIVDVEG